MECLFFQKYLYNRRILTSCLKTKCQANLETLLFWYKLSVTNLFLFDNGYKNLAFTHKSLWGNGIIRGLSFHYVLGYLEEYNLHISIMGECSCSIPPDAEHKPHGGATKTSLAWPHHPPPPMTLWLVVTWTWWEPRHLSVCISNSTLCGLKQVTHFLASVLKMRTVPASGAAEWMKWKWLGKNPSSKHILNVGSSWFFRGEKME